MRRYPALQVNMAALRHNAREVISRCEKMGISVCGVIKGCSGMSAIGRLFLDCGAKELATSRLEQIEKCRKDGITAPFILLRIPALTELPDMVRLCDTSLQSDVTVLDALEEECARQDVAHRVIIMADLGDLREGFWDKDELVAACVHVEKDLPHVVLRGVGVNLGCYGAIKPTVEKMEELLALVYRVEAAIGRKLETVSGGATSTYPLIHNGTLPAGINHLRPGESILIGKDLQVDWGLDYLNYLRMDGFTIRGEVLEVRDKPTLPRGESAIDAFGNRPTFHDQGVRRRALVGFGRADVGEVETLRPVREGVHIFGGSSDHCIVDVTDAGPVNVGDTLDFYCNYSHMLYATTRPDMVVELIET